MANFDRAIKKIIYILPLLQMEALYKKSNNVAIVRRLWVWSKREFLILFGLILCVTIKLKKNECFSLSLLCWRAKILYLLKKKPSHARILSICQSSGFLYRCYYPLTLTKFPRLQCTDPRLFFSRSTLVF